MVRSLTQMCDFHCLDGTKSTFSIEKFPRFAVGFRWKGRAASRARILSWSVREQRAEVENNCDNVYSIRKLKGDIEGGGSE